MRSGDRHQRSLEIANQLNPEDSLHSFSKKHFDAVCLNPVNRCPRNSQTLRRFLNHLLIGVKKHRGASDWNDSGPRQLF
jgi:hypothetical protein